MAKRYLLRGGFLVTMDPALGNLDGADLLIEGTHIAGIGRELTAGDAEVLDAAGMIIMPGFVDTHRHLWQGAMRGVTADWSLLNYLGGIRMHAAAHFRPEDMYAAQYHGALEAINAGVTTVADYCHNLNTPDHAFESVRALREAGLRCIWCYGFNQPPLEDPAFARLDDRIALARRMAREVFSSSRGLVTLGVSPEELPLWRDEQSGRKQFALARELGVRMFWHCNSALHAGAPPCDLQRIAGMGLGGSDLVLVHMNCTTPEEWRLVADMGASVSSTPDTEMQMGMGAPVIVPARKAGLTPTVGTDITSNNSADMFTALRLGLQAAREELNRPLGGDFHDGVPIRCEEALRWGTIGGAAALGLDDRIGSLTPGKEADIVLLDGSSLTLAAWDRSNPAGTIIQQASTSDVDTVFVGGEIRKRHGRLTADVRAACARLEDAARHVGESVRAMGGFYVPPGETLRRMGIPVPPAAG